MTPKETHQKQTEFIRVRDTGEVCKVKNISEHFIGVWEWVSMTEKQTKVYERDEVDFCTPLGFKDGKAEVVDDPTDYDGEMICIGDSIAKENIKNLQVHAFFVCGSAWFLAAFLKGGSSRLCDRNYITDHTPAHTKTEDLAPLFEKEREYYDGLTPEEAGKKAVEEVIEKRQNDIDVEKVKDIQRRGKELREQNKIEKMIGYDVISPEQKEQIDTHHWKINELIDAVNELQANRNKE